MKPTFAVIYKFRIKEEKRNEFLQAWNRMTELIRDFEGGRGSVLNRLNDTEYIAYAQWPDKQTWENSGHNLPDEAREVRSMMRATCEEVKTLYELDIIDDLLTGSIES